MDLILIAPVDRHGHTTLLRRVLDHRWVLRVELLGDPVHILGHQHSLLGGGDLALGVRHPIKVLQVPSEKLLEIIFDSFTVVVVDRLTDISSFRWEKGREDSSFQLCLSYTPEIEKS